MMNITQSNNSQQRVLQVHTAINSIAKVILGKEDVIKLAVTCLLARGHLLLEDLPGVGKTTLALTLARVFGLEYKRIQFTSDLLPADVMGVSIFNPADRKFSFHQGPVFSQVLLADEINRAPPKTQSALLEAMEENQVTNEGISYALPEPFFVIATQNPEEQSGTFRLPESQLDRFLIRTNIGYPGREAEKNLLLERDRKTYIQQMQPAMTDKELMLLQQYVSTIHLSESCSDYILNILQATRESGYFIHGLSPRAGLAIKVAAQAWALIDQRDFVLPEDIQTILTPVTAHRLQPGTAYNGQSSVQLLNEMMKEIQV